MKKVLLFLSLLAVFSSAIWSATLQEAETHYREGHFASALTAYEDLLQTYPNDPYLYYNIGNCYFKMGSKGLATANYFRAFALAPRDKDIRHNLSLALQKSGERLVPSGMPEVLHQAFFSLTGAELQGLLFIVIWLTCLVRAYWLLKRRGTWFVLTLWLITALIGTWYGWRSRLDKQPLAVVAAPVVELRSGPGNNFPASANVAQGHIVILQDSRDDWREVVVKSQGIKGWMPAQSLEQI